MERVRVDFLCLTELINRWDSKCWTRCIYDEVGV